MEEYWIRSKLGDELYEIIELNNWKWSLIHSSSTHLPGDTYCRCDIYVVSDDDERDTYFLLRYPDVISTPQEDFLIKI
jgi:hypothetical protein